MAEIAIPFVALGAMYVLSNRQDKKEGYESARSPPERGQIHNTIPMGKIRTAAPVNPPINYPIQNYSDVGQNVASYPAPNAASDRYFRQDKYEKEVESSKNPSNVVLFKSLSGDMVQKKDIKFNNMVPFFGSKVTQRTTGFSGNESLLDNYTGTGSQVIHKKEQAPLFAPQANMNYAHGVPNHTSFIQSRMNPSTHMNNVKPWDEIHVGPGLNKGFTNKGSDGFNAGMEARNVWVDKTVDQLRTATNPKLTFGLANHEGPANSIIKNRGIEGRVEKNRPDTFFMNTPDRWFTTGGQEKAQRSRAEEPLQAENRPFTTREYFGAATADQNASTGGRVEGNYIRSDRPELAPNTKYPGPAHNLNYADGWKNLKQNYGKAGYKSYPNSRTTVRQEGEYGIVGGWVKAAIAPVMDILRPSRKENVIGNLRPNGNVSGVYGVEQARVWNPADRTKTTIREQTERTYDIAQPFKKHEGGYATAKYQPIENQRQTTNCPYTGNGSGTRYGASNGPVYNAAYNAHLNPNKEKLLTNQLNVGCEPLFNSNQNIRITKFGSTTPAQGPVNMPKESGNLSTYGEMGGRNVRGASIECARNSPNMLNAFNSNPFTQPLNSVA